MPRHVAVPDDGIQQERPLAACGAHRLLAQWGDAAGVHGEYLPDCLVFLTFSQGTL